MLSANIATNIKADFVARAAQEGFALCRITRPDAIADAAPRLHNFITQNYHGDMGWMADNINRRADPKNLWPQARSVIMLGLNYAPPHNPLAHLKHSQKGLISVYAQRRDYHNVIKKKLRRLTRWLVETAMIEGANVEAKLFVDTAPIMEKPLAQAAGLGWQGKHTNLLARGHGNWLFLGSVFTTLELPIDAPESDHCGSCSACLDICPTKAFPSPYQLDARRCISYLTIEHKGVIAREFRHAIGNRIYGCDDCLAICPWNKFAHQSHETTLALREELCLPLLVELVQLDEVAFRARFAGLPIKRTGRDRFIRNVLIAMGNANNAGNGVDTAFLAAIKARLNDEAGVVRGMAVWALAQHDLPYMQSIAAHALAKEQDSQVRAEWQAIKDDDNAG